MNSRCGFLVALASVLIRVCLAETLVDTDFSQGAAGWVLKGDARLLTIEGKQVLSLTQNEENQTGVAWTELKPRVSSFSFIADIRVRFDPPWPGECPADGATMAFADAGTDAIGGPGGLLGLDGPSLETVACFEINTWRGQGLGTSTERGDCTSGKNVTFAFDLIHPQGARAGRNEGENGTPEKGGAKIGQVLPPPGMAIVNGGWYRYQWNADSATKTMSVTVTGLEARNKAFRNVGVLQVKFPRNPIDFEGRFGLTGATGSGVQHTEVAAAQIHVPMIAPP